MSIAANWLESLFGASMYSANAIAQQWQGRQLGDRVSYMGDGPPGTYAPVTQHEPGRMLALAGWTFFLPQGGLTVPASDTQLDNKGV